MISNWQKSNIEEGIKRLENFYNGNTRHVYSGKDKLDDLSREEAEYFKERFSLSKLVGVEEGVAFNAILGNPAKFDFARYILKNELFLFPVDGLVDGKTNFQLLAEILFEGGNHFYEHPLYFLFKRGYEVQQPTDANYIKELHKKIVTQEQLVMWCRLRFILLLNNFEQIEQALRDENVLFTIVSFKLKKPVGIRYPNLLGIANNAFLHYRANGDILLKAMKQYGVYDEVIKRDQKKSFKYRLEDFEMYKPLQNQQLLEIILKIFPELK